MVSEMLPKLLFLKIMLKYEMCINGKDFKDEDIKDQIK
jgi:hypothetical protein